MNKRVKSNLKRILDERNISIRQFAVDSDLQYETIRRMYNDDTRQYQRDTLAKICESLGVEISDILILVDKDDDKQAKK